MTQTPTTHTSTERIKQVLAVLGPMTANSMADETGLTAGTCRYQLERLVEAGEATKRLRREECRRGRAYFRSPNEVFPPTTRAYYDTVRGV